MVDHLLAYLVKSRAEIEQATGAEKGPDVLLGPYTIGHEGFHVESQLSGALQALCVGLTVIGFPDFPDLSPKCDAGWLSKPWQLTIF